MMAGCPIKHDNPYCSTYYRKIYVDVRHEIERAIRLKHCPEKRSHHPSGHYEQIKQSEDRIRAVVMGCARGAKGPAERYFEATASKA